MQQCRRVKVVIFGHCGGRVGASAGNCKSLHKSQRENMVSKGFQYTVITKDNWKQFIDLPKHIIEKMENGKITLTLFRTLFALNFLNNTVESGSMLRSSAIRKWI